MLDNWNFLISIPNSIKLLSANRDTIRSKIHKIFLVELYQCMHQMKAKLKTHRLLFFFLRSPFRDTELFYHLHIESCRTEQVVFCFFISIIFLILKVSGFPKNKDSIYFKNSEFEKKKFFIFLDFLWWEEKNKKSIYLKN